MDDDLELARACARGEAAAIARFEAELVARIPQWITERDPAVVDEIRQRVRDRALVARDADSPPRIAAYTGKGPLGAWVRVVALREHATYHRERARDRGESDDDALDHLARTGELSPELALLHERYRPVIAAGFRTSIAALAKRDRTLLRLAYVDGLGLDGIGRMYGVNKSTVSRWLATARDEVLEGVREYVRLELDASALEVESLLGIVPRDLEISLRGLL